MYTHTQLSHVVLSFCHTIIRLLNSTEFIFTSLFNYCREFDLCADIALETGICVDAVRNALKSLDAVSSPVTWYILSYIFSDISFH